MLTFSLSSPFPPLSCVCVCVFLLFPFFVTQFLDSVTDSKPVLTQFCSPAHFSPIYNYCCFISTAVFLFFFLFIHVHVCSFFLFYIYIPASKQECVCVLWEMTQFLWPSFYDPVLTQFLFVFVYVVVFLPYSLSLLLPIWYISTHMCRCVLWGFNHFYHVYIDVYNSYKRQNTLKNPLFLILTKSLAFLHILTRCQTTHIWK